MTVWRKLATMMPTAVIIAMAVESAPTRTEVRRKEAARLRDASIASTPKKLPRSFEEKEVSASTNAGIANADAATSRIAASEQSRVLPATAGAREASAATNHIARASHQ